MALPPENENKRVGNRFEQELSHILAEAGFWVHVFQQNKAGQPADIIAIHKSYHTLIDCKVISVEGQGFPLRRVEDNQRYAMKRFEKLADSFCWFAFRLPDGSTRMVSNRFVREWIREKIRTVSVDTIMEMSSDIGEWVESIRKEERWTE